MNKHVHRHNQLVSLFVYWFLLIPGLIHGTDNQFPLCGRLGIAVTTLPKAGTNFMGDLLRVLDVPIPVYHFIQDAELPRAWWGINMPFILHQPDDFDKCVIVTRDLRDIMVSAIFWTETSARSILTDPSYTERADAEEFLQDPPDVQLSKVINTIGMPTGLMTVCRYACDLILALKNGPPENVFVITFEELIGADAGGCLADQARYKRLAEMCQFLGYERSTEEIEIAMNKIYGHSISYNPVKKKVGRWNEYFQQVHIDDFKRLWDNLNIALGYPSITEIQ